MSETYGWAVTAHRYRHPAVRFLQTPPRAEIRRRLPRLILGLELCGIGLAFVIAAEDLGLDSWDVLHQGISEQTGISIGVVSILVGFSMFAVSLPLGEQIGIGTVLNVLLIGPSAQLGLWLIPQQTVPWIQGVVFAGGLALLAVATGLYIGARLGPGPRDGLMTGLHRRTGWRIWIVRTLIEVTVLVIGWILGGQVGIGTLAFALLIGPMVNVTLPVLTVPGGPDPAPVSAPSPEKEVTA